MTGLTRCESFARIEWSKHNHVSGAYITNRECLRFALELVCLVCFVAQCVAASLWCPWYDWAVQGATEDGQFLSVTAFIWVAALMVVQPPDNSAAYKYLYRLPATPARSLAKWMAGVCKETRKNK